MNEPVTHTRWLALFLILLVTSCSQSGEGDGNGESESDGGDTLGGEDSETPETSDLAECAQDDVLDPATCPRVEVPSPCVIHVDGAIETPGDGASWGTALSSVQEGIDRAYCAVYAGHSACQVWVRAGEYLVYEGCTADAVRLRPKVEVYGGFAGGETRVAERDLETDSSVLRGVGPNGLRVNNVVLGADQAILDGFVVEGGLAGSVFATRGAIGGGLLAENVTMTVRNCTFRNNEAQLFGGAVSVAGSAVRFDKCEFLDNVAVYGGAVYASDSSIELRDCDVKQNQSYLGGGGVLLSDSSGKNVISDCDFKGNKAQGGSSGAVGNDFGDVIVEGSTFDGNSAARGGGGIGHSGGALTISESTFKSNGSGLGEGGALMSFLATKVEITSSVFWQNTAFWNGAAIMHREGGALALINNTFAGHRGGQGGNVVALDFLDEDSLVANNIFWDDVPLPIAATGDTVVELDSNYLMTDEKLAPPGFRNLDEKDLDLALLPGSPCIDRANGDVAPSKDHGGNPRFDDPKSENLGTGDIPYVDIGAFEYQPDR